MARSGANRSRRNDCCNGTKINELTDLIKNENITNGVCEVANDNAEGQVILSGNKKVLKNSK